MKTVPLRGPANGRVALVDDDDYDLVRQSSWYLIESHKPGCRPHGPYAYARPYRDGRYWTVFMHSMLTGYERTDHIDHDGLNNQRHNLRKATAGQNSHNSRPHVGAASPYKGVSWNSAKRKWTVQIYKEGKSRFLGTFTDEMAAARAYDAAAIEMFGEFAYVNFPAAA